MGKGKLLMNAEIEKLSFLLPPMAKTSMAEAWKMVLIRATITWMHARKHLGVGGGGGGGTWDEPRQIRYCL